MRSFTNLVIGGATIVIDGTSVGYVKDASFTHSEKTETMDSYFSLLDIQVIKDKEGGILRFTMEEMSLANLRKAYEKKDSIISTSSTDTMGVGGDTVITKLNIVMYSMAPGGKVRKHTFYNCVRNGDIEYSPTARNKRVNIQMEYLVLGDTSKPIGAMLYKIEDLKTVDYSITYGL